MVGEWVGYMHSCDSLQVNRRIHLLCQGTVHFEGVHFDTELFVFLLLCLYFVSLYHPLILHAIFLFTGPQSQLLT